MMDAIICNSCSTNVADCQRRLQAEVFLKDDADLYFEDEELDRFRGRQSDAFSDDEAEEFREVMLTMRADEVGEWCQCLQMRCVEIPDQIKDELALLLKQ